MDWFHCNQCFIQEGSNFSVTSCGHIFCSSCAGSDKCLICGTSSKYMLLNDNMPPEGKKFFKSSIETALSYIGKISQVCTFQKGQMELVASFYKSSASKAEGALRQARQKLAIQEKELEELRRENQQLKNNLSVLKRSAHQNCRKSTPRLVAVTPPLQAVTPQYSFQHSSEVVSRSSSMESIASRLSHPTNSQLASGTTWMTHSRRTSADSVNAALSPASTRNLIYRATPSSSYTPSLVVPLHPTTMRHGQNSSSSQQHQETPILSIFTDQIEENYVAPRSRTERLNPIQLRFTPHTSPFCPSRSATANILSE